MNRYKLKNQEKNKFFLIITLLLVSFYSTQAQTVLNSLAELRSAVRDSNQNIVLAPGDYNIEDLTNNSRYFHCTGSNNTIDLTGVYIDFPVGSSDDQHFLITGNNNTIRGGIFENTYDSGLEEVTDFVAYNNYKDNLAFGADPHLVIQGDRNTVIGMKLIIRGSFPYGYGSMYGIGRDNVFGLDKRGGIAVQGTNVTIDGCELQMRAFGHGIYIQSPSNHTVIKNTIVEGAVRPTEEVYAETDPSSLPYRTDYQDYSGNFDNPSPIARNEVFSLCEDGIRIYTGGGSVDVENCTVKKMRGGIRTYLGSGATVKNSTAIDCGSTNWNMPNGGEVINSSGNFTYSPLSDFRLSRSNIDAEWTIIPSPNAVGSHNLVDVLGNNHNIVFHRTPGPVDSDEERAIVITGDNSTIINETEYTIVLESSAGRNEIISCGPVIDNGSNNSITIGNDCVDQPAVIPVHIRKRNAPNFAMDGGIGGDDGQNLKLWSGDTGNDSQLWVEIDRGNGYYSYRKKGTNYCIDGGNNGANGQNAYLWTCSANNQNQQWEKAGVGGDAFKLIKRNSPQYALNGGSGGANDQNIELGLSSSNSQDLHWIINPINVLSTDDIEDELSGIRLYPNPIVSKATLKNAGGSNLRVYDMNGRVVFEKTILSESEEVNLSGLSTGVYYAEVNRKGALTAIKLIKTN